MTLTLEDVNDHTPFFEYSSYETSLLKTISGISSFLFRPFLNRNLLVVFLLCPNKFSERFFALSVTEGMKARVSDSISEGNNPQLSECLFTVNIFSAHNNYASRFQSPLVFFFPVRGSAVLGQNILQLAVAQPQQQTTADESTDLVEYIKVGGSGFYFFNVRWEIHHRRLQTYEAPYIWPVKRCIRTATRNGMDLYAVVLKELDGSKSAERFVFCHPKRKL